MSLPKKFLDDFRDSYETYADAVRVARANGMDLSEEDIAALIEWRSIGTGLGVKKFLLLLRMMGYRMRLELDR